MITLEIPETGSRLYLPEDFSECNSRQYAEASLLIYRYQQEEISLEDFRIEMIYKLLYFTKGSKKTLLESEKDEMYSNIYGLSALVDSFFEVDEEDKDKMAVKLYHINNHTPVVQHIHPPLYGPADEFDDICFGQYTDALNVYYNMRIAPSKEMYYQLMAIFYKPKRKKYDPRKVQRYANQLRHIHFGQVVGFFNLFASFQTYLFSATIYHQGQEIDLSILFEDDEQTKKQEVKSKIPGLGMKSIEFQLAESGVFGPLEKVRSTDFWEIILRLYDIRKRDRDNLARQKKEEAKPKSKKG